MYGHEITDVHIWISSDPSAISRSVTSGDPGGSRTPNPQIRSLMLYPVELRGRIRGDLCQRTPI
jgi:hypothetical protein